MGFTTTIIKRANFGDFKVLVGTFANDAQDTGGSITLTHELHKIYFFVAQGTGSAAANQPIVNGSFPLDDTITIVCDAGQDGVWLALGA